MYGKPDEIQDQAARDIAAAVRSAVAYAKQLKGELDAVHKLNTALRNENAGLVAANLDKDGEILRLKQRLDAIQNSPPESTRVLPL